MDERTEVIHDEIQDQKIRQDMEATQAKLASKLGALSDQVSDAVQTATDAVENTVEAVQATAEGVTEQVQAVAEGVGDTMQAVGESFDVSLQVQRHPWLALGGAVAVGFLAARLLSPLRPEPARKPEPEREAKPAPVDEAEPTSDAPKPTAPTPAEAPPDAGPSWIAQVGGRLRSAAVGSVATLLVQAAKDNLPAEVGDRVAQEIQGIARDVGA